MYTMMSQVHTSLSELIHLEYTPIIDKRKQIQTFEDKVLSFNTKFEEIKYQMDVFQYPISFQLLNIEERSRAE